MKKLILISIIGLFSLASFGQLVRGNRPYTSVDTREGYVTINEFNFGYGLGGNTTAYSTRYYGFTTIHAFQVNGTFMAGAGTGLLFYQDGLMIPLFLDMRIRYPVAEFTPYLSGEGGMLLNPSDINVGSKMFINPSVGVRYTISRKLAATLSAGLWIQMGPNVSRASFINTKLGVWYMF